MHYSEMERYWIWLSSIDGIGVKRFYQLLSLFEDPRAVWDNISAPELKFLGAKTVQALRAARTDKYRDSLFTMLESAECRAIPRISDDYPSLLSEIYDAAKELSEAEQDYILDMIKTFCRHQETLYPPHKI